MITIRDLYQKYSKKIDLLDLELILTHVLKKTREFVLAHPEYKITKYKVSAIKYLVSRRIKKEPIAYILGQREFFGLSFKVNKYTLIPRPETELLVELTIDKILNTKYQIPNTIIDIGTGSGNIIISLAKHMRGGNKFAAIDISSKALKIAKQNAKLHKVNKKIKFLRGNLLEPMIRNWKLEIGNSRIVILANLPYLSKKIYSSASKDVKKYEPMSALLSGDDGLSHYKKLFKQIKKLVMGCGLQVTGFFEFSPEQKNLLHKLLKNTFPNAKTSFHKDLSGRWRIAQIEL